MGRLNRIDTAGTAWVDGHLVEVDDRLIVTIGEHEGEVGTFERESPLGNAAELRFEDGQKEWVSKRDLRYYQKGAPA